MIILADSGSTKCNWLLVEGDRIRRIKSRGINAALQSAETIGAILDESFPERIDAVSLHFYGAGCGERYPHQSAQLRELLKQRFGTGRIEIESDLTGAARALAGNRPGIVCILGTGSNSCCYDGRRIVANTPPLGWILGDEGSGAHLGRLLVGNLLKGIYGKELLQRFYEEERLDYDTLIRRVYREPMGNRFLASFTRFIARHPEHTELTELVRGAFRSFVERNLRNYPSDLGVSALGGVAFHFEEPLREVLAEYGYRTGKITETPDEGLIQYHLWNRSK